MPICERDPWRFQYFEGIHCPDHVRIPTDDIDSWEWYPQWQWIYNKVNIARSQGLETGTHDEVPPHFPVFSKPAVNLKGMGVGSRIICSARDFECHRQDGHMWMTLLHGEHISTDCAIVDGSRQWMRHAHGAQGPGGTFQHWTIEKVPRPGLARYLEEWIAAHLRGYTGMINFETIGDRIIEAHLRFADQWCDLYGAGWIDALVALYEKSVWIFDDRDRHEGYSLPLFASHGVVPKHPAAEEQRRIRAMPGVASLQITYYETKTGPEHPMPPGGFRLGIVNSMDLQAGLAARRALAACFPGCEFTRLE
jgi:hypothetical protein